MMKSFQLLISALFLGSVIAFAPKSSFMPNQLSVTRGSSMLSMNAAERTYIMVSKSVHQVESLHRCQKDVSC